MNAPSGHDQGTVTGRIAVVVGNPKPASRTLTVALAVAGKLRTELMAGRTEIETIDLAEYGNELLDWNSERIKQLVELVLAADLTVVGSPTYKATYAGLLKVFLDRIAGGGFLGKIAVPVMVVGAPQHALVVENHLRPLLVELGATCPTPGLCVLESDLGGLDVVIDSWWSKVALSLIQLQKLRSS